MATHAEGNPQAGTIRYFAFARRPDGKIGQLIVTRGPTRSQEWTGVTYRSVRAAYADMERLNCAVQP
jgi:hypothetical protein